MLMGYVYKDIASCILALLTLGFFTYLAVYCFNKYFSIKRIPKKIPYKGICTDHVYKDKKNPVTQLIPTEAETDNAKRFFLVAHKQNGQEVTLNLNTPLTLDELEIFFEQELEKACIK